MEKNSEGQKLIKKLDIKFINDRQREERIVLYRMVEFGENIIVVDIMRNCFIFDKMLEKCQRYWKLNIISNKEIINIATTEDRIIIVGESQSIDTELCDIPNSHITFYDINGNQRCTPKYIQDIKNCKNIITYNKMMIIISDEYVFRFENGKEIKKWELKSKKIPICAITNDEIIVLYDNVQIIIFDYDGNIINKWSTNIKGYTTICKNIIVEKDDILIKSYKLNYKSDNGMNKFMKKGIIDIGIFNKRGQYKRFFGERVGLCMSKIDGRIYIDANIYELIYNK